MPWKCQIEHWDYISTSTKDLYNQIDISKNLVIKLPTKLNISMRVSQFVQAAHLAHVSLSRRSIKRGSGWFSHGRKQQFSNLFCLLLLALFILFCPHQVVYLEVCMSALHHVTKACSPVCAHLAPDPCSRQQSISHWLPPRPVQWPHCPRSFKNWSPAQLWYCRVCSLQYHSFPSRSWDQRSGGPA